MAGLVSALGAVVDRNGWRAGGGLGHTGLFDHSVSSFGSANRAGKGLILG
jgi:hypothetical protein